MNKFAKFKIAVLAGFGVLAGIQVSEAAVSAEDLQQMSQMKFSKISNLENDTRVFKINPKN